MKIECKTTFLDGRERYEAGDVCTVDDAKAAYFVKSGWAAPVGEDATSPAAGETDLVIDNSVIGVLLSMPGEHMNLNLAQAHRAMFSDRIATVGARVSKDFSRARSARHGATNFY